MYNFDFGSQFWRFHVEGVKFLLFSFWSPKMHTLRDSASFNHWTKEDYRQLGPLRGSRELIHFRHFEPAMIESN